MNEKKKAFAIGFQKEAQGQQQETNRSAYSPEELAIPFEPYGLGVSSEVDDKSRLGLAAAHNARSALTLGGIGGGLYSAATGQTPGGSTFGALKGAITGSPTGIKSSATDYFERSGIGGFFDSPSMRSLKNIDSKPIMKRLGKGVVAGSGLTLGLHTLMNIGEYGSGSMLAPDFDDSEVDMEGVQK